MNFNSKKYEPKYKMHQACKNSLLGRRAELPDLYATGNKENVPPSLRIFGKPGLEIQTLQTFNFGSFAPKKPQGLKV